MVKEGTHVVQDMPEQLILRAVLELPFNVGKHLLADFVRGGDNDSIVRNELDVLDGFGCYMASKDEVLMLIDRLLSQGFLVQKKSGANPLWKVLDVSPRGREALTNPDLLLEETTIELELSYTPAPLTEADKQLFAQYEDFLSDFTDEQKKAIVHDRESILCIAGAGSGKTTVLTKRIEFLVKHKGVDPKTILAITFTRKARQEMAKRLRALGVGAQVETFNSFCERILRVHGMKVYGRHTRIMSYSDKMVALTMALAQVGHTMETAIDTYFTDSQKKHKAREQLVHTFMNDCFTILEYFKTRNSELVDFSSDVDPEHVSTAKMVYGVCKYLQKHIEMQGLRDFSDQVVDVVAFFKQHRQAIPQFEHILVDEYQDVNALQVELLDLLAAPHLFCVGDPRQSIFGWRGSDISFILEFPKHHPKSEVLLLTKNYRSAKTIVDFMNASIKDMGLAHLEPHQHAACQLSQMHFDSELGEYEGVAQHILEKGVPLQDVFVLSRTNKQLQDCAEVFKRKGIPFSIRSDEAKFAPGKEVEGVTLATIHAIKGLEAHSVYVIGCSEMNFPCKASDHPIIEIVRLQDYDKDSEERRLFYVAISRAKEALYLTYTGKRRTSFVNAEMEAMLEHKS